MCLNVRAQETTKESASYPMSALSGLVTEGSNLLLMRLIALRKKVPEHMTFISFDLGLHIIHTTFVSNCASETSCSFCVSFEWLIICFTVVRASWV